MGAMIMFIFLLSLLCIVGFLYYLLLYQKSSAYPPRYLVMKRMRLLGGSGGALFLMGCLYYIF